MSIFYKLIPILLLPSLSVGQQQNAPPAFKGQSELVLLTAIVQDKHGAHVSGLSKDDFKVLENGKPQEIKVFDELKTTADVVGSSPQSRPNEFTNQLTPEVAAKPHRLTIIAFDLMNMPTLKEAGARKALWDFLGEAASTMEPTAVYSIGSRGVEVVSDFTTDPRVLAEALKQLKEGRRVVADVKMERTTHEDFNESTQFTMPPQVEASGPPNPARNAYILQQMEALQKEMELNVTSQMRRFVVVDTLAGLRQIAQACALIPGRKALVWVTGGFPFDISPTDMNIMGSAFPGRRDWADVYPEYQRTWRALNDAQVVLYPIDVRGITDPTFVDPSIANMGDRLDRPGMIYQDRQTTSADYAFASATGGRAFYSSSDLKKGFEEAARDSDDYYVLGYYIAVDPKAKPGWRTISVKGRPGLEIRARSGYFYNPTAADLQTTRERDLQSALFSPINLTALAVTARWTQQVAGKKAGTSHAEFELVMPANFAAIDETDKNHIALDILALARTPEGKVVGDRIVRSIDGHLNETQLKQVRERGFTYANALDLPAGNYVIRFVVRDGLNGRIGSVVAPLKVGSPSSPANTRSP